MDLGFWVLADTGGGPQAVPHRDVGSSHDFFELPMTKPLTFLKFGFGGWTTPQVQARMIGLGGSLTADRLVGQVSRCPIGASVTLLNFICHTLSKEVHFPRPGKGNSRIFKIWEFRRVDELLELSRRDYMIGDVRSVNL